jgi:hypothetical protein
LHVNILTKLIFLSRCMFVTSLLHAIPAHLFLLSCMLVTSLLHVILVVFTHYFSCIYQSSLFLCSRIPFPPVFAYRSSQRDHCFLHGCPSFALPLNPSLKSIYTLPLSTPFFCSVLLVAYYFIYSVDWTGQRNVLFSMLIFLWRTMYVSHYLPLLFLYHNTQSPFPCYLYQHDYLINHQFRFNVSRHYILDVPSSLLVVHHYSCCPFLISPPPFFSSSQRQC